jgi:hypothetical protein
MFHPPLVGIFLSGPADPTRDFDMNGFVNHAQHIGLPVGYLNRLIGRYQFMTRPKQEGPSTTDVVFNYIEFLPSVKSETTFELFRTSGNSIGTVFHECVHAYFDLYEDEPPLPSLKREGVGYYGEALLKDGSRPDNPNYVFNEAAANYVGSRVAAFANAYFEVMAAKQGKSVGGGERAAVEIGRAMDYYRKGYNNRIAERVFGYDPSEMETTSAIMPILKTYLDTILLESKIPDDFAKLPFL